MEWRQVVATSRKLFSPSVNSTDASGRSLATISYTSLLPGAANSSTATIVYGMYTQYHGVQGANLAFFMRFHLKTDDGEPWQQGGGS